MHVHPSRPLIAKFCMFLPHHMSYVTFCRFEGTLPLALASLLDNMDRLAIFGGLLLDRNPWEHPPEAIVTGGVPAVRDYFEAIYRGGTTAVT